MPEAITISEPETGALSPEQEVDAKDQALIDEAKENGPVKFAGKYESAEKGLYGAVMNKVDIATKTITTNRYKYEDTDKKLNNEDSTNKFMKIGKRIYYSKQEIDEWIKNQPRYQSTADRKDGG